MRCQPSVRLRPAAGDPPAARDGNLKTESKRPTRPASRMTLNIICGITRQTKGVVRNQSDDGSVMQLLPTSRTLIITDGKFRKLPHMATAPARGGRGVTRRGNYRDRTPPKFDVPSDVVAGRSGKGCERMGGGGDSVTDEGTGRKQRRCGWAHAEGHLRASREARSRKKKGEARGRVQTAG